MRLLPFLAVTFVLPGLTGAVLWRWALGARARGADTLVWIAGSPFLAAAAYYVLLGIAPGRGDAFYVSALTLLFLAVPLARWRTTGAVVRGALRTLAHLVQPLLAGPARRRRWARLALLAFVLLYVRVGSQALNQPVTQHDALIYAAWGRDWHDYHDLAYWHPEEPSPRGFLVHNVVNKTPCLELLYAWAADWMPARYADTTLRSVTFACHLLAVLPLLVLGRGAGRWGPLLTAALFLSVPPTAVQATLHGRLALRILGGVLLVACLMRCRRLPWPARIVGVALGIAAAITAHPAGLLATGLVLAAWAVAHWRRLPQTAALLAIAVPLAVAVGGKTYALNALRTGGVAQGPRLAATDITGARWDQARARIGQLMQTGLGTFAGRMAPLVGWHEPVGGYHPPGTYIVLLGLAAVGGVGVARRYGPRVHVHRLVLVLGLVALAHLAIVLGLVDLIPGAPALGERFANTPRYRFYMYPLMAVLVPHALRAVRGRAALHRVLAFATVICVVLGVNGVWLQTDFLPTHQEFPEPPPPHRLELPAEPDFSLLARLEQVAGGGGVLVVDEPAVFYYTSVSGFTYRDPRMRPVYDAKTPAEQHQRLWALGIRYIVVKSYAPEAGSGRLERRHDALGFSDLFADPQRVRLVERTRVTEQEYATLYMLLPPGAAAGHAMHGPYNRPPAAGAHPPAPVA